MHMTLLLTTRACRSKNTTAVPSRNCHAHAVDSGSFSKKPTFVGGPNTSSTYRRSIPRAMIRVSLTDGLAG